MSKLMQENFMVVMVVLLVWVANIRLRTVTADDTLDLILLHNNDLHGRFVESTIDRPDCRPEDAQANKCYGGFARISTIIKRHRYEYQMNNGLPVLFLNAGDTYVGTPFFYLFKHKIASDFMNILSPDVGALGNHEFDYGIKGLVPFLEDITFPIAVCNLNISTDHRLWRTNALHRSVVFDIKEFTVGVIGYVLPQTVNKSETEDVGILSEIDAINEEAKKLNEQGVKIIIALGHSGYKKDQEIAKECPLVDVVVGGHSHTLLYTGTPPDPKDIPLGPYPTVVEQENGKKVPVVQAMAHSKYLGKLELSFDNDGNLLRWDGRPILLDNKIPRDPEVLGLVAKYQPAVEALTNDIIGISTVELERKCTTSECNIGNLITDAWVYNRVQQVQQHSSSGWTDASIAFVTGGAIRSSAAIGNISKFTLSTIIPFNNTLYVVKVPGNVVKSALERAVQDYVVGEDVHASTLFQMSGARVVYDLHKEPGQRLQSADILCSNCSIPSFQPLDDEQIYGVIIEQYIYNGIYKGEEGFTMFLPYEPINMNMTSLEAVSNYIKHVGWIYPAIEGRIKFVEQSHASTTSLSIVVLAAAFFISQLL